MKTSRRCSALTGILAISLMLLSSACATDRATPQIGIDLQPFVEFAREAGCAQRVNRIWVIDDQLVFWDRRGDCPDNAYRQVLFADDPDQVLCELSDSIMGPRQSCEEEYQDLFNEILENLDAPDLGLGANHQVVEIGF